MDHDKEISQAGVSIEDASVSESYHENTFTESIENSDRKDGEIPCGTLHTNSASIEDYCESGNQSEFYDDQGLLTVGQRMFYSVQTNGDFGIADKTPSFSSDTYWSNGDALGSGYITCRSEDDDLPDGVWSDVRSMMSRPRSESAASLEYYRTDDTDLQISAREGLQSQRIPGSNQNIRQSRRLPFWLWYVIAKCLGIKLNAQDRPIFATILYSLTFFTALGYVLSNWWFTGYDIASDYTKTTVIDGTVSVSFSILWVSMGVYANKLGYRLFSHKKFLNMLRLHSKTILKMNASAVLFTLMLLFAIVNNIGAYSNFKDETCTRIGVEVIVCKLRFIMRALYSVFAVIWNFLIAFVVISVCRTHVIGIRKFMQALEQDARIYEAKYMGLTQQSSSGRLVLEEYAWLDEDYMDDLQEPGINDLDSNASVLISQQGSRRETVQSSSTQLSASGMVSAQVLAMPSAPDDASTTSESIDVKDRARGSSTANPGSSQQKGDEDTPVYSASSTREEGVKETSLMSNSEILFRYWKIQSRLRISSLALQRWMISLISLVVVWLTMNLMMWLTYDPTLIDLANFFLPLALLPLMSSAYAEVNQEGSRLLKFICLVEERLQLIFVLQNSPLQMTVFGFTLSYSTITTAAFGILLAFASKVLIQEVSEPTTPTPTN